ncbi:MAG TPA: peptidylprolyl isomerase [Burkholderiaceae bacterium]|nr:peptidylprolyl isomerase [Burkholderiaceae bacterium]
MQPADSSAQTHPQVLVKTSLGEFVVELYPDKAPQTVSNFLQYVNDGFYSGTIFHRVIGNFMIQGGGFTRDMSRKQTRAPIPLESKNGLRNDTGWLAMARTSQPDSATSQFFINTVDNTGLNHPQPDGHGYAVFGRVIRGMETVNQIRAVKTRTFGMHQDVPVEPVVIDSMTVIKPAK